jgi:hypothetical protein
MLRPEILTTLMIGQDLNFCRKYRVGTADKHTIYIIQDIISPNCDDRPEHFWSYIKSKRCDNNGVTSLKSTDGIVIFRNKAEILNKQFTSVFTQEDNTIMSLLEPSPYSAMSKINISNNGVRKLLHNLKSHKASGPDSIPANFSNKHQRNLFPHLVLPSKNI